MSSLHRWVFILKVAKRVESAKVQVGLVECVKGKCALDGIMCQEMLRGRWWTRFIIYIMCICVLCNIKIIILTTIIVTRTFTISLFHFSTLRIRLSLAIIIFNNISSCILHILAVCNFIMDINKLRRLFSILSQLLLILLLLFNLFLF